MINATEGNFLCMIKDFYFRGNWVDIGFILSKPHHLPELLIVLDKCFLFHDLFKLLTGKVIH
jgi:hypothetical protein